MPTHGHNYYEIMYVLSGCVTHEIEDNIIELPAGSLLLMHHNTFHKVRPCSMDDIAVSISMGATLLLTTTRKSVGDIAAEVGITSVSHFYKLFLEEYRMTPTEYRSRYAKSMELSEPSE